MPERKPRHTAVPAIGRCAVGLVAGTMLCCAPPSPSTVTPARAIAPLTAPELALRPAAAVPIPTTPPTARPTQPSTSGARSLGRTGHGSLERAAQLPIDSPALRPTPGATRKGATFGHHTLIAALVRAATRIRSEHPESILFVGDVSRRDGGAFSPHASHTNGRDVDLAFFVHDESRTARDAGAMTRVLPSGAVVGSELTFDVERNWLLVEYLLRDPSIQVQWIFVAAEVKALLMRFAEDSRRDPTMIDRASRVMLQPRDSSPHNDHFHVRIYCSRDDRLEGCLDGPPFHPWVDDHSVALGEWLEGVAPFFALPGTDEYRWALEEVAANYVREALPLLRAMPEPEDAESAALRQEVIGHLTRSHQGPNRWRDLEPTDSPP